MMKRLQPIDGQSCPEPQKGLRRMFSYESISSKRMQPSKEKTKLPLLRGWTLHRLVLSAIGLPTLLAMPSLTSRTMASAARYRTYCSVWGSAYPPARKTVTSVIAGSGRPCLRGGGGCWVLAALAAAPAYEAGVRLTCLGWAVGGTVAPVLPLPFLRRGQGGRSWGVGWLKGGAQVDRCFWAQGEDGLGRGESSCVLKRLLVEGVRALQVGPGLG